MQVKTFINPDGRTVENLGRGREGSGIVIDDNGLVLTIGYLMVEAHAAEIRTNERQSRYPPISSATIMNPVLACCAPSNR